MAEMKISRLPFPIVTVEKSAFKETYGGAEDVVVSFCQLIRAEAEADTCLVTMHPIGGTGWLPIMNEFVGHGVHVLACDGRYRGVDTALNMEKVTIDLGNAVRHAKEKLGYKNVVLLGWSGGGSLSAFYQSQAENPTVTSSPCGGGPDLTKQDFVPADGLILMAAHVSRHGTLTQWMDASITDETDPERRDSALDIYGADIKPPYAQAFLETYRAAQIARNRKITAWVKHKLQELADKAARTKNLPLSRTARWLTRDGLTRPLTRMIAKPDGAIWASRKSLIMARGGWRGSLPYEAGCRNGVMMTPMPTGQKVWRT